MNKTLSKIAQLLMAYVAVAALAGALVPATAFGDEASFLNAITPLNGTEEKHGLGLIPVEEHPSDRHESASDGGSALTAQSADELPASYDSRTQPWASAISVRDQDNGDLCWAFSTITSAEYSYAKNTYEKTGAPATLSPGHLGYFLFHRVNDPLNNTAGDANHMEGGWLSGCNPIYALMHMSTYSGASTEAKAPYNLITDYLDQHGGVWDESYKPYSEELAYDDYTTLQEGAYIHQPTPEMIKRIVYERGAASFAMYVSENYEGFKPEVDYNPGRSFYNYEPCETTNHAVVVVGWDDNYEASNFAHTRDCAGNQLTYTDETGETRTLTDEEAIAMTTPEGDGAWIIQNSWGSDAHDDGFFYMSYYSAERDRLYAAYFDMQPADTYEYNFQYDGTADYCSAWDKGNEDFCTNAGTKAANVFVNTTAEPVTIESVGVMTASPNDAFDFDVSVYTGLTDPTCPTSGILASGAKAHTKYFNYKTVELDEPVAVGPGERFSVVLSFDTDVALGVEQYCAFSDFYCDVQTEPGQSFFLAADSDTWKDINDYESCYRIKALANGTDPVKTSFTVRFEDGLGNVISIQTVAYGAAAVAPANPTREGYRFDGWDSDFSNITANLIVSAKWEKEPGKVTTSAKVADDAPVDGAVLTTTTDELLAAEGLFTDEELSRIKAGENASVWIEVTATSLSSDDMANLQARAAEKLGGSATVAAAIDIALYKRVGSDEPDQVTDPGLDVGVSIDLLDSSVPSDADGRSWCTARKHSGEYTALGASFENGSVTFNTEGFSAFAIAYGASKSKNPDEKPEEKAAASTEKPAASSAKRSSATPKTGDAPWAPIALAALAASSAAALASSRLRRRR